KNKFSYDNHIQQFALLLLILSGRNYYEFLRLNLPAALPHISNIESLMKKQEMRIIEYCISAICRIDYDSQLNSFIGFSSPLIDGMPQPNFFQTENFDELKMWFNNFNKSKFNNIHTAQTIVPSASPLILSV
ncbi:unnamed protein product, partial [Rotaria sordida]